MEQLKSALADHFYESAMSIIADENYEIIIAGGFRDSDFAEAATAIYRCLVRSGESGKAPLYIYAMGLYWKVKNNMPGFVICSDGNRTGVSRTESSIFLRIYGIENDDVKELLDMMNEAWSLMNNNG